MLNLHQFLSSNPSMRLSELTGSKVVIKGQFSFCAAADGFREIRENLDLEVTFLKGYPKSIPVVAETSNKIPRIEKYHTYENGSFCLGSDIRLKSMLKKNLSIEDFFKLIVVPFLYSVFHKMKHGVFPIGDLYHGSRGLVQDYEQIFCVKGEASVIMALEALGKRKRVANKLPCPCMCGLRLGRCAFRHTLSNWRELDTRRWYRSYLDEVFSGNDQLRAMSISA